MSARNCFGAATGCVADENLRGIVSEGLLEEALPVSYRRRMGLEIFQHKSTKVTEDRLKSSMRLRETNNYRSASVHHQGLAGSKSEALYARKTAAPSIVFVRERPSGMLFISFLYFGQ